MSKIKIVLDNRATIRFEVEDFQKAYISLLLAKDPQTGSGYLPVKDVDGRMVYINTDKIATFEAEQDE